MKGQKQSIILLEPPRHITEKGYEKNKVCILLEPPHHIATA
jgi:hypothetical protein